MTEARQSDSAGGGCGVPSSSAISANSIKHIKKKKNKNKSSCHASLLVGSVDLLIVSALLTQQVTLYSLQVCNQVLSPGR